ncbi:unnamed protein product [Sphagnum jensenii]|uniref:Peptidase S9A N-terminal domain-containing protein n=1 Tax=Sphagnum jensenii TaxID=128206 RepID=A0ABP1BSZ9_9BRYO
MQETVGGDAEVLLDPNTWSEDGTVALAIMKFSEDAEFLAYGQSASGSHWITIRVMHVADRVIQPAILSWLQPSASVVMVDTWVPLLWEKVGIDAGTEIEKNLFHELYYHLLNTDQSEDVLCWRSL